MNYSFIVLAYNEENNIATCIDSIVVQRGLGRNYEILVVNDGSTDDTPRIVRKMMRQNKHIRLLGDGKNHGRGYGRALGVEMATGKYVAMIDGDIILPEHWLKTCLQNITGNDVVGGVAVPDGDVAHVHRMFKLEPKVVPGTTTVAGCNGFYKSRVFKKLRFNADLREGEDVDFNNRARRHGIKQHSIAELVVEHHEHKSFLTSMHWLYESGIGATRQLFTFKEIRVPDIAFAVTLGVTLGSLIVAAVRWQPIWLIAPVLMVLAASFMHLHGKFRFSVRRPHHAVGAVLLNSLYIACYYVGRIIGAFIYAKNRVVRYDAQAT